MTLRDYLWEVVVAKTAAFYGAISGVLPVVRTQMANVKPIADALADKKKEQAAKDKQQKEYDDNAETMAKVNVDGLWSGYHKVIENKTAVLVQKMQEAKSNPKYRYADYTKEPEVQKAYFDVRSEYNKDKQSSVRMFEQFKEGATKPDQYDWDENLKKAIEVGGEEGYNILKEHNNSTELKGSDEYYQGVLKKKSVPFDEAKALSSMATFAKNIGTTDTKNEKGEVTTTYTGVSPQKIKDGWDLFQKTDNYKGLYEKYKEQDPNKSPVEANKLIKTQFYNSFDVKSGTTEDEGRGGGFVGNGNSWDNGKVKVTKEEIDGRTVYNINELENGNIKGTNTDQLFYDNSGRKSVFGKISRIIASKTNEKNSVIAVSVYSEEKGDHEILVPYNKNKVPVLEGNYGFTIEQLEGGTQEKQTTMKEGEKQKGKTYKIGNKDYSEAAVAKAAKASGMSVSEYVKEANK